MTRPHSWPDSRPAPGLRIDGVRVLRSDTIGIRERMRLNYATLERLAASLNGLKPTQTGLLRGRMRHFTREGFPVPLAKGRGARSSVGIEDGLRLLFAFELVDTGLPPGHAMRLLRDDWDGIRSLLAHAWLRVSEGAKASRERRLLVIEQHLLADLGADSGSAAAVETRPHDEGDLLDADGPAGSGVSVGTMTPSELAERMAGTEQPRHCLVLDAEQFMRGVADSLVEQRAAVRREVTEELRMFSADALGIGDGAQHHAAKHAPHEVGAGAG